MKRDGLSYFRATEYYGLHGEFFRFRDPFAYPEPQGSAAAKSLRDDLERIISQSNLVGIALVIPLDIYWTIRNSEPAAKQIFPGDPFEIAIQCLMDQCVRDSVSKMSSTPLAFYCDDGPNSARMLETYRSYKALNPKANEVIKSFVVQDDRKFQPLQAADLMAHLGRECYMTKGAPKRITGSVEWVKVLTEDYLLEMLWHEKKRRNL